MVTVTLTRADFPPLPVTVIVQTPAATGVIVSFPAAIDAEVIPAQPDAPNVTLPGCDNVTVCAAAAPVALNATVAGATTIWVVDDDVGTAVGVTVGDAIGAAVELATAVGVGAGAPLAMAVAVGALVGVGVGVPMDVLPPGVAALPPPPPHAVSDKSAAAMNGESDFAAAIRVVGRPDGMLRAS